MNSYYNFSPADRYRALAWFKAQGKPPPTSCSACGEVAGILDWHSEDYSEPYTLDKIGAFSVCYVCHMFIHCRFGAAAHWREYVQLVDQGARFAPFHARAFPSFAARFLRGHPRDAVTSYDPYPGELPYLPTWLGGLSLNRDGS